jgi:hypothetical protein
MAQIIGRQIELGLAKETTRGTAKTTADRWIKNVTANVVPKAQKVVDNATRGRFEDADQQRLVRQWYEGDVDGIAHADALGWLFLNMYGTVSSVAKSAPNTAVYDHTFSVNQTPQHNSLTLFVKDGGVVQETISNCMIDKLSISATMEEYVRFKATFMGAVGASNSASPSYGTEYDFVGRDITVKMASTSGGLAGATAIPVKSIDINWSQGIKQSYVFGAYTPTDLYNTMLAIDGKMKLDFSDTTYRALWQADTAQYLQIVIQGAATIGTSSNPAISLTLNKAQLSDWNRSGANNDIVEQDISFKGFYNATDSKQSTLILTNLQTSY